jgi:hypothetical protein
VAAQLAVSQEGVTSNAIYYSYNSDSLIWLASIQEDHRILGKGGWEIKAMDGNLRRKPRPTQGCSASEEEDSLPRASYVHLSLQHFVAKIIFAEDYKLCSFTLCNFPHLPVISCLVQCSFQYLVPKHPLSISSPLPFHRGRPSSFFNDSDIKAARCR